MIISDCSFKLDPQQTRKARQSRKAITKARKAISKNKKEAVLDFSAQPLLLLLCDCLFMLVSLCLFCV